MNAHKHFKWQHHVNMFFFILLFQKHMKAHEKISTSEQVSTHTAVNSLHTQTKV